MHACACTCGAHSLFVARWHRPLFVAVVLRAEGGGGDESSLIAGPRWLVQLAVIISGAIFADKMWIVAFFFAVGGLSCNCVGFFVFGCYVDCASACVPWSSIIVFTALCCVVLTVLLAICVDWSLPTFFAFV